VDLNQVDPKALLAMASVLSSFFIFLIHTMITRASAELKGDNANLRTELKGDNANLRTELKGDNATLRTELKGDNSTLRAELKGDNETLRKELKGDNATLRTELKGDYATLCTKLESVSTDLGALNSKFDHLLDLVMPRAPATQPRPRRGHSRSRCQRQRHSQPARQRRLAAALSAPWLSAARWRRELAAALSAPWLCAARWLWCSLRLCAHSAVACADSGGYLPLACGLAGCVT
jgi:hypothetical protein